MVVTTLESNKAEKKVGQRSGRSVKWGHWGHLTERLVFKERVEEKWRGHSEWDVVFGGQELEKLWCPRDNGGRSSFKA